MVASGASMSAQIITGTWQGTLPVAENPRVVLKIAKDNDGSLRGTYYAIDRGPDGIPLTLVSFVAPELNVAFIYGDISYKANPERGLQDAGWDVDTGKAGVSADAGAGHSDYDV
jgi:hypothetical protein